MSTWQKFSYGPPDMAVDSAVRTLVGALFASLLQSIVMSVVSFSLYKATSVAYNIYRTFGLLQDFMPILWRYRQFFAVHSNSDKFPVLFSICLANILVHVLFLIAICWIIFSRIDFEASKRLSMKGNLVFFSLTLMSMYIPVEMIVGPLDLNSVLGPTADQAPISIFAVYFRYCLLAPAANAFFAFIMVGRFAQVGGDLPMH
jgi:hypothetical protein